MEEKEVSPRELPKIPFGGKEYTFDQRLCELRSADPKAGMEFIKLREAQCELLAFALGAKDSKTYERGVGSYLVKLNMEEIMERD